jgi:DNA-binding response OmpR family regulator
MNTSDFTREIEKANRRLVELRRAARADGPTPWSEGRAGANGEEAAMPDEQRVLVVDDNQDACEILAERLQQAGYQVALAHDGHSALAAARDAGYQIALVDLGLPDMDGYEVCRTLKAERPQLYVVALTGYSDQRARARAEEAGFDRFLVKPLDSRQVVATLAELLARDGS